MAPARMQTAPFSVFPFLPTVTSWHPHGPTLSPYHLNLPTQPLPPISFPYPDDGYQAPSYPVQPGSQPGPKHDTRLSSWVSSMAAAGSSNGDAGPAQPLVEKPFTPAPPPPSTYVLPPPTVSLPRAPHTVTNVSSKTPSLIIGMNPDQDRHSKHGTFNYSPHTITSLATGSPKGEPYVPNPARTVVMEQLPKTHRNRDFIKSWSKSACGAHPVYFAVDPASAKALIEFATAELARKAWGSPKLGGAPGPPVKGKPRADLIRVWWYRVDGVGAGAGVGELEEGEIEGDAGEREVSVPPAVSTVPKKETKKEKKVRLAQERQAKMVNPQQARLATSFTSTSEANAQDIIPDAPIYSNPPAPADTYPDSPPPAYGAQTPVWPILPGWSDSASGTTSSLSTAPLPTWSSPRSEPASHWSLHPPSNGVSMWSSSQSPAVISKGARSSSADPVLPPSLHLPKASSMPSAEMDVDADMELDTPASGSFPYPLPSQSSGQRTSEIAPVPPGSQSTLVLAMPTATSPPPALDGSGSSSRSTQPSTTPPLEPRAMKNAPKGPSFVKRSLVARQKELEERIARGKLELGLTGITTDTSHVPAPSPVATDHGEGIEDAASMEDNLRRLVLKSQKNKLKPTASESSVLPSASTPSSSTAESATVPPTQPEPLSGPTVSVSAFSFDDLAVSFITETIQNLLPGSVVAPPPPPISKPATPVPSTNSNLKQELAEKQRRLQQQIAESKTLMAQLAAARSKQEKDRILAMMREKSRYVLRLPWLS
ncbi:hypothetical protein GGX14DRAFT_449149 [Mycena pura]|uniref:Uncharacterized protein n=1 Tax=Mycena pura TaxID=153505 RepID=A0AAD6YB15_9AGAR|nr:hypothetical protein GGX14DRAFT_449149 [Mycena pura]